MKYWQYKPLGWLFGGISRLPFGMLYVLSDILFVLLYHVVGYRRKVALKNIADSFPDKSPGGAQGYMPAVFPEFRRLLL